MAKTIRLLNTTQKTKLVSGLKVCRSTASQALGLMFSKPIKDEGLLMVFGSEQIVSLHMLFVFFPIDVLFVDRSKRVVEIVEGAKPFVSYITPSAKALYVIELPADTVRKSRTKLGDRLEFKA